MDTAGEEDYQNMFDSWINQSKGFILVFAINDLESFNYLTTVTTRLKKHEVLDFPIVVIGNKSDLENKRQVPTQQAKQFALSINAKAKYFETTALNEHDKNVKAAFEECANMVAGESGDNDKNGNFWDSCCRSCSIFCWYRFCFHLARQRRWNARGAHSQRPTHRRDDIP